MISQGLLPCPFCGSLAEFIPNDWNEEHVACDDGTGWVECQGCCVQTKTIDKDEAIALWNARAPLDIKRDSLDRDIA